MSGCGEIEVDVHPKRDHMRLSDRTVIPPLAIANTGPNSQIALASHTANDKATHDESVEERWLTLPSKPGRLRRSWAT